MRRWGETEKGESNAKRWERKYIEKGIDKRIPNFTVKETELQQWGLLTLGHLAILGSQSG